MKRDVLDKGYVELIDSMGGDFAPVDAARVSFNKRSYDYPIEKNRRLLRYLLEHDHGTPFEMVVLKWQIKAPVVVWWQWVRHRIASYNFVSGRYVPFDETEVYRVADDAWRMQATDNKQGSSGEPMPEQVGRSLNQDIERLYTDAFRLYSEILERGGAKEQARLVLPFAACYYEAIFCVNMRSLMNFLKLRMDLHAQSEIQDYAVAMANILWDSHPEIMEAWKETKGG